MNFLVIHYKLSSRRYSEFYEFYKIEDKICANAINEIINKKNVKKIRIDIITEGELNELEKKNFNIKL